MISYPYNNVHATVVPVGLTVFRSVSLCLQPECYNFNNKVLPLSFGGQARSMTIVTSVLGTSGTFLITSLMEVPVSSTEIFV